MFKALREAYSEIQNTREEVQKQYDEFDMVKWANLSIDTLASKFHPARLPKREALPDLAKLLHGNADTDTESKITPPAQRKLSTVIHQRHWLLLLDRLAKYDEEHPHPTVKHRELKRFVSASQPYAGSYQDMSVDNSDRSTLVPSPEDVIQTQRHFGLHISIGCPLFDAIAAEGGTPDRVGDTLANCGDQTKKHNRVLDEVYKAIQATAPNGVCKGDKESPDTTAMYNDTHVTDIVEVGGAADTGADTCHEVKVKAVTTATHLVGKCA